MTEESVSETVERLLRAEHFDEVARARLGALGEDALTVLKRIATGPRRGERGFLKSRAILALAEWPDDEVLDTLSHVLDESDLDNRIRASMALGAIGGPAAIQRLSEYASRAQTEVELSSIARAFGKISDDSSTQALYQLRDLTDSPSVIAEIEEALGSSTGS